MEPKFKRQHEEPASLPTIINEEEEYEVEKVQEAQKTWERNIIPSALERIWRQT